MKTQIHSIVLIATTLLLLACQAVNASAPGELPANKNQRPKAKIVGPDPHKSVVYKVTDQGELKLNIFQPEGHQASDNRPAIVFFFGGGWTGGSPRQFHPQCDYLAKRGMVAISAEYRIKSKHKTDPRACVRDGKSAIRYVREHAHELGINPEMLAAGGGSAGGHVAAATGTVPDIQGLFEPSEDQSISSRPNALVLFNPVYDNSEKGYGYSRVKAYWQAISPMHNLSEKTPPTIVFLGDKDKLIPVATAESYQSKMKSFKKRSDLHVYEGQPHGFFNYRNKIFYEHTVALTDRFLVSLGYLEAQNPLPQLPILPEPKPENEKPEKKKKKKAKSVTKQESKDRVKDQTKEKRSEVQSEARP